LISSDTHSDHQRFLGDVAIAVHVQEAPTNFLKQLYILEGRYLRAWKRHPMMLVGEGIQYMFFALFIGVVCTRVLRFLAQMTVQDMTWCPGHEFARTVLTSISGRMAL
jgi:hypothetical protein